MMYMYTCDVYNINFDALPVNIRSFTKWTYFKLSLEISYKYIYAKINQIQRKEKEN